VHAAKLERWWNTLFNATTTQTKVINETSISRENQFFPLLSAAPTSHSERIETLDVLRGFALLGVLLANMASHSGYFFLSKDGQEALGTSYIDHYFEWFEHFLIDGKFYSLFSMLFGIGFALQMKRSEGIENHFSSRFRRRLLIMFILGTLHAILLYIGDILAVYALTALVLMLYRNASNKSLLRSAFIFTLLPLIQYAIFWGINLATPPEPVISSGEGAASFFDQLVKIFQTGTFLEITQANIGALIFGRYPDLIFTGRFFRVLAMFLIGFYISRNILFGNVNTNRPLIRKVMIWGAIIGIPCNVVLATMMKTDAYYQLEPIGIIQPLVYAFGVPALCLFYTSAIVLLFENLNWRKLLMVFAPVGQIALTNYLMQSLICVFIFKSYGLGLTAQVGPAKLTAIAFIIYIAQVIFSHAWVKFYRFGPMEWLWRSLTYWKRQPFRKG